MYLEPYTRKVQIIEQNQKPDQPKKKKPGFFSKVWKGLSKLEFA